MLILEMFNIDINEGKEISIKPKKVDQNSKRLWGMNRSLINNAVIGSSTGYEKILELVGVGYRAALKRQSIKSYNLDIVTILILIFQKELKLLLKNKLF